MSARTVLRIAAFAFVAAASLVLIREVSGKSPGRVERYGMVIGIKPEKIDYYKKLHAAAWPGVLARDQGVPHPELFDLPHARSRRASICLFSYFEYTGERFRRRHGQMAADPETQRWWKETDPCQSPIPTRGDKEFWSRMEEVFHPD